MPRKMPRNMFSMQKQLLILFIYQQFLCHAIWATRTATATATPSPSSVLPLSATSMPTPPKAATSSLLPSSSSSSTTTTGTEFIITTPPTAPPPLQATTPLVVVSSSEATLLTKNFFPSMTKSQRTQRRQYFKSVNGKSAEASATNALNGQPSLPASTKSADNGNDSAESKNNFKIIALHTNCSRDLFEMHIELNRGFRGLLYAKDFPLECRARGSAHSNITLRLPTSGCGVRAEPRSDGNMELSVRIMLQMEQKLRQSADILRTVRCKLPLTAMGMAVTSKENNKQRQSNYRNGRMRTFGAKRKNKPNKKENSTDRELQQKQQPQQEVQESTTTTTTTTPRVRIWLELGDRDGSGVVEVGEETTLTVRTIVPGKMGVHVVDCAALDGLGESTQQLLDDRGCPIDEQVMPALHTSLKPAEEGWSKQNEDDLVEKTFTATFPAFKFPDRERLHVSCGVQLCKGPCPDIDCRTGEQLVLSMDKHLARIEVFNSLAVTAPQIEVDRLRYDRRYNMSVEEYPPYVRQISTEGTLCMSVSKLAISFCILGVIFLAAVVVAIFSLIRSRRHVMSDSNTLTSNASRLHRTEVCTSMFSSSSGDDSTHTARFGSKLFIPYYPTATMPYGRVY